MPNTVALAQDLNELAHECETDAAELLREAAAAIELAWGALATITREHGLGRYPIAHD